MTRTPPFRPLSNVPLPLPPASTWALMTISSPPSPDQWMLPIRCLSLYQGRTNILRYVLGLSCRASDFALWHTNAILRSMSNSFVY